MEVNWQSEADTKQAAERLAGAVAAGDVICLEGDLGVGKTVFTRYLARALGIEARIQSPTFTIVREYESGRVPLYHIDAYRLEETGAEGIGLEEYLYTDGVAVIEWPQFMREELSGDYLWLSIERRGETARAVTIEARGTRGTALARALAEGAAE